MPEAGSQLDVPWQQGKVLAVNTLDRFLFSLYLSDRESSQRVMQDPVMDLLGQKSEENLSRFHGNLN